MYSKHHAVVSALVAATLALSLSWWTTAFTHLSVVAVVAVVLYGTALGVFIDLDHFLIARIKTGNWDAVRFCLANPVAAVADQGQIFDQGDVGVLSRLLSHVVLIGLFVPLHFVFNIGLGIIVGVVLYVHLLTDLIWDVHRAEPSTTQATDDRPQSVR
ncbi:hypothetical protein HALLA_10490 [Halostagnicola larsenii XH-48]|uniref:Uncharacterized protein n=1 Tax=Halostagnicola larsenii XH-48 TaxID=797299 RepID=W0JKE8_9EURY|nr:hypothetical protein [Halostagnicola larsenii]AHF99215.1 hypothetical protein HALLA_10490 [Halostagnicola larsenii XH-48]